MEQRQALAALLFSVVLIWVVAPSCVSGQNSTDEQQLRRTFAKIEYAYELQVVADALHSARQEHLRFGKPEVALTEQEIDARIQEADLRVAIDNLESGPIHVIADRQLSDIVNFPSSGKSLELSANGTLGQFFGKELGQEFHTLVRWVGALNPLADTGNGTVMKQTVRQLIEDNTLEVDRYLVATVTVHYEGQSVSYRGLYLLTRSGVSMAIDVVAGRAVMDLWGTEVYPYILIAEAKSPCNSVQKPMIVDWLQHTAVRGKCRPQHTCYEPGSGRAGVPADDVASLTIPAGQFPREGAVVNHVD